MRKKAESAAVSSWNTMTRVERCQLGFRTVVLLLAVVLAAVPTPATDITNEEFVLESATEVVLGSVARLPCDLTVNNDTVRIVMWYRRGAEQPFYSYDARSNRSSPAHHRNRNDPSELSNRTTFRANDHPAQLTIEHAQKTDADVYRCRVDYARSPTRNSRVNLTVIIPPDRLVIEDQNGTETERESSVLGPYNEGSNITIKCTARGGRPTPKVSWWQENALLDDISETVTEGLVSNTLRVENLKRKQFNMTYTCQASNNQLSSPVSSSVTIDLNLMPLSVRILGNNKALSAGKVHDIFCEVVGARPTPEIGWWFQSHELTDTQLHFSDNYTTTSVLRFKPSLEDSNKTLFCRAMTPTFPQNFAKEGKLVLNISHAPLVSISLTPSSTREGGHVYLDCNVKANPPVRAISWTHNNHVLTTASGVLVSNQTLTLENVTRTSAGAYVCRAVNEEGEGVSAPANLEVTFVPVCRSEPTPEYQARPDTTVSITCPYISHNNDNVTVLWQFVGNATSRVIQPKSLKAARHATAKTAFNSTIVLSTSSKEVTYSVGGMESFGTLLCWARGSVGEMQTPCMVKIVPEAGKPEAPSSCSVFNLTSNAFTVECLSLGWQGAGRPKYVLEAFDSATNQPLANLSNSTASWRVSGLSSGKEIGVLLYAANVKGRSQEVRLRATTLQEPQYRTASPGSGRLPLTGLLGAILGSVCALLLLATLIVVVLRLRGRGESQDEKSGGRRDARTSRSRSGARGIAELADSAPRDPQQDNSKEELIQRDEKEPDVIPYKSDEYLDEDEKAFQYLHRNTSLCIRPSMQPLLPSNLQRMEAPTIGNLADNMACNLPANLPGSMACNMSSNLPGNMACALPPSNIVCNLPPSISINMTDFQPNGKPRLTMIEPCTLQHCQGTLRRHPTIQQPVNGGPESQKHSPLPLKTTLSPNGVPSPNPTDSNNERAPLLSVTSPQPLLDHAKDDLILNVPPPRIYRDTKF